MRPATLRWAMLVLALLTGAAAAHPCDGAPGAVVLPGDAVPVDAPPGTEPAVPCDHAPSPAPIDLPIWPLPGLLVALGAARRRRAWAAAPGFACGAGLAALVGLGDLLAVLPLANPVLLATAALALAWPRAALPAALVCGTASCAILRIDLLLMLDPTRTLLLGLGGTAAAMALIGVAAPALWRRIGPVPAWVLASWCGAAALMATILAFGR